MNGKKIFWGLFFILAATLVILNQLNIFIGVNIVSLFLSIFLVAILIKSIIDRVIPPILFSIAFLLIIYAKELQITELIPAILVAALLGSIGLSIIFGKHPQIHIAKEFKSETIDEENDNVINIGVSFGEAAKYVKNENLEKVNLSCSFGAAKLYLDEAKFKDNKAILHLEVSFAGVEIYVPKNCKIENKANVSLGAIEEKNRNLSETAQTLIITGNTSFSGVEIIYV